MLPFIHLGPLTIPTYGLMMAIAFAVGAWVTEKEFRRRGLARHAGWDTAVIAMICGLIGSKVNFLFEHPEMVRAPLRDFFGGMTWFGGFILGTIGVLVYWRARNVRIFAGLDAVAPALTIGYAIARQGCQISGDGDYGIPSNLPWAMAYPHGLVPTTVRVHPTPVYETLFMIGLFVLMWRLRKKPVAPGILFGIYLVGYGFERFLVEFIRRNSPVLLGLTEAQLMSVVMAVIGLVLLLRRPRGGAAQKQIAD